MEKHSNIICGFFSDYCVFSYPFCWTVGNLTNNSMVIPAGWEFAFNTSDPVHTDIWCNNTLNVQQTFRTFPAHSAPLGLIFYTQPPSSAQYAFSSAVGNIFVTFHATYPTPSGTGGYEIRQVQMSNGVPLSDSDFFYFNGTGAITNTAVWPWRPVDVKQGINGELFVTSDGNGAVLLIRNYQQTQKNAQTTRTNRSAIVLLLIISAVIYLLSW